MTNGLARIAAGACILALAACSSGDGDDSAKISALEADLEKAQGELETAQGDLTKAQGDLETARTDLTAAETEASNLRAEADALMFYNGFVGNRRISGNFAEETRADDGSLLTIEFSGAEQNRADIVLDRTEDTPPAIGDATGERFDGENMPRRGVMAHNVAVLYRIPLGENSVLQYGWWAAEGNSAGRTWMERYGPLVSARPIGGITGIQDSDIAEMTGSATFEGHAAGLYAISNPDAGHNESGEFIADAMLTVNFDDASASGMIDGFVAGGEEKGWTVSLLSQGFVTGTPAGSFTSPRNNDRAEVQWTISDAQNTPGQSGANWWFAALVEDAEDSTAMGAIGEFSARYTNIGAMSGTFGAKKQ